MTMPSTSMIVAAPSVIIRSSIGESEGERTGRGMSILAIVNSRRIRRQWAKRMMGRSMDGMEWFEEKRKPSVLVYIYGRKCSKRQHDLDIDDCSKQDLIYDLHHSSISFSCSLPLVCCDVVCLLHRLPIWLSLLLDSGEIEVQTTCTQRRSVTDKG